MSNLIVTHVDLLLTVLWSSAVSLGGKKCKNVVCCSCE